MTIGEDFADIRLFVDLGTRYGHRDKQIRSKEPVIYLNGSCEHFLNGFS